MPTISQVLNDAGVLPNGKTQLFATTEAQRMMNPYVPVLGHGLRQSARPVDSNTAVEYQTPYAHYQYKGELYVDPITGKGSFFSPSYGHWSRPNVDKVPSGKPLNYHGGGLTGPKWDEKMIEERGDEYIQAVQKFMDKGV